MARRQERLANRASARLLEEDLGAIAQGLHWLRDLYRRKEEFGPAPWIPVPERLLESWRDHRPRIAKTLAAHEWYAVVDAYRAVGEFMRLQLSEEDRVQSGNADAGVHPHDIVSLYDPVKEGFLVLSRLAGRPRIEDELGIFGRRFEPSP
jgi:hypothetical protein